VSIHRIAMWSGPRNISTAMMRSWGNRPDTWVCDEPLYAHYLLVTGKDHPGREDVISHHQTDWRQVVRDLLTDQVEGKAIHYQKHMAHHLLPDIDRAWLDGLTHAFLIRDPLEMLTSLIRQIPNPTLEDTGLPQQVEIFRRERDRTGSIPVVIDARDILHNPTIMLDQLCRSLNVTFDQAMLSWPAGPRATDGIWAKHWYQAVEHSTGFEPWQPKDEPLPDRLEHLHERCRILYDQLAEHRLRL
jgi:hypothetical protein